jgi:delta 1-pyrroline-5-carboxylate dehydrogenase
MEARQMALQSRSPQRPDDLVVEVEEAGAVAVDQAVGLAREAAGGWAAARRWSARRPWSPRPTRWPGRPARSPA